MQTRVLNEATIGLLALGKAAELGRQLTVATDSKFAGQMAKNLSVEPESLQTWANGYIAFDSVISVMGVLGMIQGMRKNRKGAGRAAYVQAVAVLLYSVYYLLWSLFGLKGAKTGTKLTNVVLAFGHAVGGVIIYRFSQRALK